MNYSEIGGYSGELFAVPGNSGNIVAWTSILGINNYDAIYDPYTAYIFHLVGMERKEII
jgi:hypothetical protein